jgi:hypothetical protein
MAGKNTAVFGIYPTTDQAERAVDILMAAGFPSGDISVLLPDNQSSREFAHEKDTKAPEGTATGVTAGGIIGGTLGVLAGIGALAIPGLGPFIAAGPIMAGLAGVGVGGAVGGIVGALVGMGIPEYEAKRYEGMVKNGGNLLSVHCDTSEQIKRAKDLLKSSGAHDVASTSEASGDRGTRSEAEMRTTGTNLSDDATTIATRREAGIDPAFSTGVGTNSSRVDPNYSASQSYGTDPARLSDPATPGDLRNTATAPGGVDPIDPTRRDRNL